MYVVVRWVCSIKTSLLIYAFMYAMAPNVVKTVRNTKTGAVANKTAQNKIDKYARLTP